MLRRQKPHSWRIRKCRGRERIGWRNHRAGVEEQAQLVPRSHGRQDDSAAGPATDGEESGRDSIGSQGQPRDLCRTFEFGTWGGEIRSQFAPQAGDIAASEHWCSSGFANTDLDLLLKRHGVEQLIVVGLIAHTCVEATVRFAAELGYEVTMVRDATTSYSNEHRHAALDINIPNYAAVVTTDEVLKAIA